MSTVYKQHKLHHFINTIEEALTFSCCAVFFTEMNIKKITNQEFKRLQDKACEHPHDATCFARIKGADIEKCQTAACRTPYYAYNFALTIQIANIEYCQKHACKEPQIAYYFALNIPKANLKYCEKQFSGTIFEKLYYKIIMKNACQ